MDDTPRFPFVAVDVPAEAADEASGLLFELGAEGIEERDATTLVRATSGGHVTLVASFPDHAAAGEAIAELKAEHGSWSPRLEEIVGDAWRDAWKEHFAPFLLCDDVVVCPPWQRYEGPPVAHVLELEPGRAFGTGLHESTGLVAAALARHRAAFAGRAVLDVGCGSGILALVALALGASRVRAVDNDPDVIGVVVENAERNGLSARVQADTAPLDQVGGPFALVAANIEADTLIKLAPDLGAQLAPGGLLVLSGVLVTQQPRVCAAFSSLKLVEAPVRGEWVALVLERAA